MANALPFPISADVSAHPKTAKMLRPLDLAHLYRQTMGNRALEIEILDMFCKQVTSTVTAYALKGTGRSVGAFLLADIAEQIEKSPFDRTCVAKLNEMAVRTCDFAASVNR
jgi:HPt (histidine-containing phosphotransfer) domain-containing protein